MLCFWGGIGPVCGRTGVCGTGGGATGAVFGVESGSVAPTMVPLGWLWGGARFWWREEIGENEGIGENGMEESGKVKNLGSVKNMWSLK